MQLFFQTLFHTTNNLQVILSDVKSLSLYITRKHIYGGESCSSERFKHLPHKFDQSGGNSKFEKWNLIMKFSDKDENKFQQESVVICRDVRHIFNEILLPFNYYISRNMPVC